MTQIALGTNTTFTTAGEGEYWDSHWGLGGASSLADLSYRRNEISAWAVGIGGGSAGAWNGRRFQVTGSGSRFAYVDFYGTAHCSSVPSLTGSTNWQVDVVVYDSTLDSIIGNMNVFSASHSISLLTYTDGGNISNSVLVSLQAGHEYVVYVKTTGDCSQYGTFASTMASDSGNYTTTWSSIRIRWQ